MGTAMLIQDNQTPVLQTGKIYLGSTSSMSWLEYFQCMQCSMVGINVGSIQSAWLYHHDLTHLFLSRVRLLRTINK